MGKKNRSKRTPRPPRRTSSRKRNRTEKGLHDEQFEKYISMSANETSVADKSGNLNCTESHVQTNTEDSPPSSSTADQTDQKESNASDGIESLLTQRTPEVPPDQVSMTPRVDTTTPALSSDSSTPGVMCIGKESRGKSVNLMLELEKAAEIAKENREENDIENSDGNDAATISEKDDTSLDIDPQNSNDTVFLNSLYELHLYHQSNTYECGTAELEKKVSNQEKMIETLVCEKKVLERQVEGYTKEMFEKEQKLKIMADRVKQLENSNNYRKEVARLEMVVEQREVDLRTLEEELKGVKKINIQAEEEKQKAREEQEASMKKELDLTKELEKLNSKIKELEVELKDGKEKVAILEENKTFLLNENTILKNEDKS